MERDEDRRGDQGAAEQELETGETLYPERAPGLPGGMSADPEATDTDGKGTGGTGADAGGYGPVPGSESAG